MATGNVKRPTAGSPPPRILVLEKSVAILSAFTLDEPELSLAQLTAKTRLPKTTVHRLLYSLQLSGLISQNAATGTYSLGPKLLELGALAFARLDVRRVIQPYLDELSTEIPHTIVVCVLADDRLLYIDKRDSRYPLRIMSEIGQRRPAYFGAVGRAIMAFLSDAEVDRLLAQPPIPGDLPPVPPEPAAFKSELRLVRERGYAVEDGAVLKGVVGVAAPIFGGNGQVVASVGVAVPHPLLTADGVEPIGVKLAEVASRVSAELGWRSRKQDEAGR